jgi:hypothetical protein
MSNRTLKIARIAAALSVGVAVLAPSASHAQNMDMSWALQSQANLWQQGQATAYAVANSYYQYMLKLRAAGYTGPSLPTGVTNESLRASINGANQAGQSYIASMQSNSARTSAAINGWTTGAIRGQANYVDPNTGAKTLLPYYSSPGQVQNVGGAGGNNYMQDAQGTYWKWSGNGWTRMTNGF